MYHVYVIQNAYVNVNAKCEFIQRILVKTSNVHWMLYAKVEGSDKHA